MSAYNFGVRQSNLIKLLQVTCREAGVIKRYYDFDRAKTHSDLMNGKPPLGRELAREKPLTLSGLAGSNIHTNLRCCPWAPPLTQV